MPRESVPTGLLIGIELTTRCDLGCRHCLRRPARARDFEPAQLESILRQAEPYGRLHLAFTGGEPTLHPEAVEILRITQRFGHSCHFVTNGQAFEDIAAHLKHFRDTVEGIAVSLDGATAATHEQLRGPGTYAPAAWAIATAARMGLRVTVQMSICRVNRCDMQSMTELCARLGVHALFFCHMQPTQRLYELNWQLTPREWLEVETQTRELAASGRGVPPQLAVGGSQPPHLAPCMALQHQSLNIDAYGRLTLCCQLSGTADEAGARGSDRCDIIAGDIIADLGVTPLGQAHQQLLRQMQPLVAARLTALNRGSNLDRFHCWFCQKYFGRINWMHAYPDDPWVCGDRYFT